MDGPTAIYSIDDVDLMCATLDEWRAAEVRYRRRKERT